MMTRPRVRDLVFQVYSGALHPELFEILAVRRFRRGDAELTLQITRTGHVLSWASPQRFLTEVTATAEQALPSSRRLIEQRLRGGEHTRIVARDAQLNYQMGFQVEVLPPDRFRLVHDEILSERGKRGLLHDFQPGQRLTVAPLGYVAVEARAGCLFVSTFHTFPDESTVVRTQSLIERPPWGDLP